MCSFIDYFHAFRLSLKKTLPYKPTGQRTVTRVFSGLFRCICGVGGFAQSSVDGAAADAQNFPNLSYRYVSLFVKPFGSAEFVGGEGCWSSASAATGPGSLEPGVGSFADEVSFEFGEGSEDVEYEPAAGGAGVDVLL